MIMLPVPFVKDLYNAGAVSHVAYRLNTDTARRAAAGIWSLLKELQAHEASSMRELLRERHRRLSEIDDQEPGGARERKLLKLRQAAFRAAAVSDHSGLPTLVRSDRQYSIGHEAAFGEDALVRLMAENTNRLRHATQLCQLQHHASLWEHKALALADIADSSATTQAENDYARSGADFFRAQSSRLRALAGGDRLLLTTSVVSAPRTALQAEIQQLSQQHRKGIQLLSHECLSWSDRVEKLTRLAAKDTYFSGELSSARRSLAVAQARGAAMAHVEAVQAAAVVFVESLAPSADANVTVSSSTAAGALQAVFHLDADTSHEIAVLTARIAVAEVRVQALSSLREKGFASWWEAASAKASLEDLRTEVRRLNVVRQIRDLAVRIVEDGEPILPQNQPLAMSR